MDLLLATSIMDDYPLVECPVCQGASFDKLHCLACGFMIEDSDGVLDLRIDRSFDTLLDTETYADQHSADRAFNVNLATGYLKSLQELGAPTGGQWLEIACGPGTLTGSLLLTGQLSVLHTGDISPAFMSQLAQTVRGIDTPTVLRKYLFDANRLPFKDQAFDVVIGNSVLHHFAQFENTIRDASRVLRAGGAATFGEPILDAHAFISLAAGLIVRAAEAGGHSELTRGHIAALRFVQKRAMTKIENLYGDRNKLRNIEDKFIFPMGYLKDLAAECGFRSVEVSKPGPKFDLGDQMKELILRVFKQQNLDPAPLEPFEHVFRAIGEDYGRPMARYLVPFFATIVFLK